MNNLHSLLSAVYATLADLGALVAKLETLQAAEEHTPGAQIVLSTATTDLSIQLDRVAGTIDGIQEAAARAATPSFRLAVAEADLDAVLP